VHSNGVGQKFYDCNPLGTYNEAQARAACAAYTKDAALCVAFGCSSNQGSVVCSDASVTCYCWKYAAGSSSVNGKVSTTCGCPDSMSATSWN
jgi:hypothetical protein